MPDTQSPQVPPTKDPNKLPDMSPPQPEPTTPTVPAPSVETPAVPAKPVSTPAISATAPTQTSSPQVPASTLSSSEQSINPGENNSGMGSGVEVPPGVDGWGWGPFFFTGIWGIFNNVWISLLAWIPIFPVGLIMAIVLGINGRKWAWQKKKWKSVEHFNEVQRKWSKAGVIIGVLFLLAWLAIFVVIVVVAINPAERISQENSRSASSEVRKIGSAVSDCIDDQISKETPINIVYSDKEFDLTTGTGGCASSDNLINGQYVQSVSPGVTITSGVGKVCVSKPIEGTPTDYASYDSSEGVVSQAPNGTARCS